MELKVGFSQDKSGQGLDQLGWSRRQFGWSGEILIEVGVSRRQSG